MRTVCSFPGCKTGTASERRFNKMHGLRNKTLFAFPKKNPWLRNQWENVIQREAKDNEVICELHFCETDIKKNYEIVLSNEQKHTMERGKISLNPTAIPQYIVCQMQTVMETNQHSEPSISNDYNINVSVKCQRHCEIVDNNNDKTKTVTKIYSASIRKPNEIPKLITSDMTSATCDSKNDLDYNILDKENLYPNIMQSASRPNDIAEIVTSDMTFATCDMKNDLDYNILDKENLYLNIVQSEPFTLQQLNCQLKYTALPQGWGHVQLEKFLVLAHWTANAPSKKEFHIYSDGSIQTFINKHITFIPGIKPGTTVDNLVHNIEIVQPLLICNGTGINDRYSRECKRYIDSKKSYIRFGSVRCIPCKNLRRKLTQIESKRRETLLRLKVKAREKEKVLKNLKAKIKRLTNKLHTYNGI